ncbi:ATP-binding protein [Paenibacillus sp. S-38]|uniref:ATP-binding protein n=1 Tax=Paenibacillus sp. S-38 TaxID=3416710 RepID=UPI003CE6872D
MRETSSYKIRPAARHILTIGEDLIQDKAAAILELVKNAYDADSQHVTITFRVSENRDLFNIIIEDHGHGMSFETVTTKWMVPSTDDKVIRRKSPLGRIMQGRKGIGRYAANILGKTLLLETTQENTKTTLFIEWDKFSQANFLDEVDIQVDKQITDENNGTRLTVEAPNEDIEYWYKEIDNLRFELKKLIPPNISFMGEEFDFNIILILDNFKQGEPKINYEEIRPYPILELFDYKISGRVTEDGVGKLTYVNQKARNTLTEELTLNVGQTNCGTLLIDIRVYDRDKESIEQLISRGLKDEKSGQYLKNLETRQLLNHLNGIGVYRNGFRIRPLGDADFDWLKLNEQRVQNPSQNIGSNQVIGYVHIESEEKSGLEETSARDGLKKNDAYERLREITLNAISKLEERRFIFRRNTGLTRAKKVIEKELEKLYDYTSLQKSISLILKNVGLNESTLNEVSRIIESDQKDKNQIIDDIKSTVAIYQGQATLGRIINVILHEGRRPLNYFTNQMSNLEFYSQQFKKEKNESYSDKILSLSAGFNENASIFVNLFSRLDPLAAKKRAKKTEFKIIESIETAVRVFDNEMKRNTISFSLTGSDMAIWTGWKQDIYTIITNLIDNSIFWMSRIESERKAINISIIRDAEEWVVDYQDSGPGIEPALLESGVIFEPEFTTKPNGTGTGLGLAIAGEAAQRNGLELIAISKSDGAHFKLYPNRGDSNGNANL